MSPNKLFNTDITVSGSVTTVSGVFSSGEFSDSLTVSGVAVPIGSDLGFESGVVFIREVTLGADAASIDFDNIPQEATNLMVMVSLRTTSASSSDGILVRFNDDSGTNYDSAFGGFLASDTLSITGLDGAGKAHIRGQTAPVTSSPAGNFGPGVYNVLFYSRTDTRKGLTGHAFNSTGVTDATQTAELFGGQWRDTSAITKVSFITASTDDFLAGSKAVLYGLGQTTADFTENVVATSGTFSQHLTISGVPVTIGDGGGGASTLQEAYDGGDGTITTTVGKPFHVIGDEYDGNVDFQVTGSGKFTESLQVGSGTVFIHGDVIETPALIVDGTPIIPSQPTSTTISGVIARNLSSEHSPVGLWHFEQNLLDESGNSFDMTVKAGVEQYSNINGLNGFRFENAEILEYSVTGTALEITGDLTVEILVSHDTFDTEQMTFTYNSDNNSEDEVDNIIYSLRTKTGGGYRYFAESGAGVNEDYAIDDGPPLATLTHATLVRESDQISIYINGYQVGGTSVGLSAVTGGTAGNLRIGDNFANPPLSGIVCGLKVMNTALTAEQVFAEYEATWALAPITTLTDATVSGIIGNKLGLNHSPVALYLFEDNITDSSGNGLDLSVGAGAERYTNVNGLRSAKFDSTNYFRYTPGSSALEITGDITIQFLLTSEDLVGTSYMLSFAQGGDAESANALYACRGAASTENYSWFSESGVGVDASYGGWNGSGNHTIHHLTYVRESDIVTLYIDGAKRGSSGTLATPTGGTSAFLDVGAFDGGSIWRGTMACVKIIDSALTASQVYAEYETTWADAPSSSSGGGSSVDETQVALLSQVFGS